MRGHDDRRGGKGWLPRLSRLVVAGLLILPVVSLGSPPAEAQTEPSLTAVSITPANILPGDSTEISLTFTNVSEVRGLFFDRPSGISTTLPVSDFTQSGDTFTATIEFASNAATGTWKVSEVLVTGTDGINYRFLNADVFTDVTSCSTGFEDIGELACASDVLAASGDIEVGGTNFALPVPELSSVAFSESAAVPGGSVELTLDVTNADLVNVVFFQDPSSGAVFGSFAESTVKNGTILTASIPIPEFAEPGTYEISEIEVLNAIAEPYRFLNSTFFSSVSTCPNFVDGGAAWICSTGVLAGESLTVGDSGSPTADLEATSLAASVPDPSARTLVFQFDVTNTGNEIVPAGSTEVEVFLDLDSNLTRDPSEPSQTFTFPATDLAVGETETVAASFESPPAGSYLVVGVVDPSNLLAESDEGNNLASAAVEVLLPDLELAGPFATGSLHPVCSFARFRPPGCPFYRLFVSVSVINTGDARAGASQVVFEVAGEMPQAVAVRPLDPGQSTRVGTVFQVVSPGPKFVHITVDPADIVREINEDNNETLAFTFLPP